MDSLKRSMVFKRQPFQWRISRGFKVKLLQKIENRESIDSEDIVQLYSLSVKVAKERDELKTATDNFIKRDTPKARASDLYNIPGGVNSTVG